MMEHLVAVFAAVSGILLLIVLTFLYKLTVAVGRIEGRLERLMLHLRDLDLAEVPNPPDEVFGFETEIQHAAEDLTSMGTDPAANYTPAAVTDTPSTAIGDTSVPLQAATNTHRKSATKPDSPDE